MTVVAVIDHDLVEARLICDSLLLHGDDVLWADDAWKGILMIHRVRPDVIVINYALPQALDLLTLLRSVRSQTKTRVVLIAPVMPEQYYLRKFGICGCVLTPFDATVLNQYVEHPARIRRSVHSLPLPTDVGTSAYHL